MKPASRFNPRLRRLSNGQGLVEFALVFPLLIAVFFAILEFGFYMMTNLTLQNATREGARMASTLIDLDDNDSRVITFVDSLIPNTGPFAGFTAISNTGDVDCEESTLITVTIEGEYNFVALNFLGLNGIDVEYPATTHYELCGVFPVSDTAVPTAATLTPSNTVGGPTATRTPTPSRTVTPSHSPTATRTPTRTPTGATATSTRTATPTFGPIEPPVWVSGTYNRSGSSCNNINLTWDSNNDWADNPGFGPTTYTRYRNGVSQGTQSANYPNNVSWSTGTSLSSGQTVVFEFVANFSGGLTSMPLWKSWTCSNGNMVAQNTPTPTVVATNTRTPTPSRTPTASHTATRTFTASITPTFTRTPTPSRTPTHTNTPQSPAAPVAVGVDWDRSGWSCTNIQATWDANSSAWSSYPGFGNSQYERFRNGVSAGTVSANYPNNVTWFTGDTLSHNQSRTYSIIAIWSNGLESLPLAATLTCQYGSIIAN